MVNHDDPIDLRRIRLRLTLAYGLAAGLVVVALSLFAINEGVTRIDNSLDAELSSRIADVTIEGLRGEFGGEDTWLVVPIDDFADPLGEVSVEPPVFTIADEALDSGDGAAYVDFSQFDEPYRAFGRAITEEEVVVVVAWSGFVEEETAGLVASILIVGGVGLVATTGVSWVVAGRSLRPAREAMQRRQDFIADAAHQLRTPLAVIQASASQALSGQRASEDYRRSLAEIRDATARAGVAVSDLLELARLESGATELRRQPVRLDLLVEEVMAASAVSVDTEVHTDEPIVVDADYTLLRQAIANVVANAAERASTVTAHVHAEGGQAVLHVVDDGPGFPPEVIDHVFERFRRGDRKGSSGLGLAITHSVLEAHGGKATAENSAEGGAVVTLRLPLGR